MNKALISLIVALCLPALSVADYINFERVAYVFEVAGSIVKSGTEVGTIKATTEMTECKPVNYYMLNDFYNIDLSSGVISAKKDVQEDVVNMKVNAYSQCKESTYNAYTAVSVFLRK